MTKLNSAIELKVNKSGQYIIEQFIEDISDKLMINDTYFGNLISGISELFGLLLENQQGTTIEIIYSTDYQLITFDFFGVSRETSVLLADESEKNPADLGDSVFTIFNLTERLIVEDNKVSLIFDIGAVNRNVYNNRKSLLNDYFKGVVAAKTIKSHD